MKSDRKSGRGTYVYPIPAARALFSNFPTRDPRALNSWIVAEAVFEIEKALKQGPVGQAVIPVFEPISLGYDLAKMGDILHELLVYVLVEDIDIKLKATRMPEGNESEASALDPCANVCLFSGGVDSYSGVLLAKQVLGDLEATFCAHSDQSKIIHLVRNLTRTRLARVNIPLHKVKVSSIQARGYAQLRGFLYTVSSAAWMQMLNANTLVVTECGPTMYQPRFAPFDIVTMTTHPIVLEYARQTIGILLQREVSISTPFEDLTKAEVMAICPDKEGLKKTHSCISQRFGTHDGTCYGCVIRRLAAIASGTRDVRYDKNIITDERASSGNLFSLLTYCLKILTNYSDMQDFETETVEEFGKHDLFRRFALDNFAAIHRIVLEGHRVRRSIRTIYDELRGAIGSADLDDRLAALRLGNFAGEF
jgi:7-cyano-7-deazaguanine synthase in queuosine biosynthesis